MSDWASALQRALAASVEPPPAGWVTLKQLAKDQNWTEPQTRRIIADLGNAVEKKKFIVVREDRRLLVPHYRLSDDKASAS